MQKVIKYPLSNAFIYNTYINFYIFSELKTPYELSSNCKSLASIFFLKS